MSVEHDCATCSQATGCTARRTEEKSAEEIKAGPYLVLCAVIIVAASLLWRWLF
jgi:hypothetical protein